MFLTMNSLEFGDWVQVERDKRGWSQSDLSRYSGLHRAVISKIESGTKPMPETLSALAHAFKISPITIFRKAGLLPSEISSDPEVEDLNYKISLLSKEDLKTVSTIADALLKEKKPLAQPVKKAKAKGSSQ